MRMCAKDDITYFACQLSKARITGKVSLQRKRVHEESNQSFGFEAITASERRSDDNVILSGVSMEQGLKNTEQQHENRYAFIAAQKLDAFNNARRKSKAVFCTAAGWFARPRTIPR